MKQLFVLAAWAVCGCASSSAPARFDLKIQLTYDRMEHSKDSHGSVTTLVVEDGNVVYSCTHHGAHAGKQEDLKFTLTKEQLDRLSEFVQSKGLKSPLEETQEDGGRGTSVEITLEIAEKGRVSKTHLSGMTHRFGKEGPLLKSTQRVDDIDELVERVKGFSGN